MPLINTDTWWVPLGPNHTQRARPVQGPGQGINAQRGMCQMTMAQSYDPGVTQR